MVGARESGLDRGLVAEMPVEAEIARGGLEQVAARPA